ncbi:hypothetical protein [Aliidiomarina indica]|uniref:hypothetical protein n=1 Tax=Aliidiomarina indica TaxID=2749147 RepID=UPI0018908D20|nr:hypothetical protein [Aliidiomarina indica]
MELLHSILRNTHIIAGTLAIIAFWGPILTKKGSRSHKQTGSMYRLAMLVVAASAITSTTFILLNPSWFFGEIIGNAANPEAVTLQMRSFASFLFFLSVLTLTLLVHASLVIRDKEQRKLLRHPSYSLLLGLLVASAVALAGVAIYVQSILYGAFALIGIVLFFQIRNYVYYHSKKPTHWLHEHIGAFIGSGIGAYTAVTVFGASRLLSGLGSFSWITWILPGLIGSFIIYYAQKRWSPAAYPKRESGHHL